ncbi:MAG: polymer-forming cytoskeletal protein, partial [Candidatus Hodarchaeales archaeon]
MKEYDSNEFAEDAVIDEDIIIKGSVIARGNLKSHRMIVSGALEVGKDLECSGNLTIKGKCHVKGTIKTTSLSTTGSIEVTSIEAISVQLAGKIAIRSDITAVESIVIKIRPKRRNVIIIGLIKAPKVRLTFDMVYTKWSSVPGKLLSRLGLNRHYKKVITIENLNIETDKLVIESPYPVDMVECFHKDCEINARETEFFKMTIT